MATYLFSKNNGNRGPLGTVTSPDIGFFIRFTRPVMNFLLWTRPQIQSESSRLSSKPLCCYCTGGPISPARLSSFVLCTYLLYPFRDVILSTVYHLCRKGAIPSSSYSPTSSSCPVGKQWEGLAHDGVGLSQLHTQGWGDNQNVAQWPP